MEEYTLSDFMNMEIVRTEEVAEIIFGYDEMNRPCRLLGFTTDADKSDFEIAEEGLHYWRRLVEEIRKNIVS